MQYPNTYKALFQGVVANSASLFSAVYEIKSFFYGESRRIEEGMKSEISYPSLWLELPEFSYIDTGDNMIKSLTGAFIILGGLSVDSYEGQDDMIDLSIRIAEKVIKEMKLAGFLNKGDTIEVEPVTTQMADNCYGCRVSFKIRNMEGDFLC